MRLLVIVNNHNSFSILDLCYQLIELDSSITLEAVCSEEFFNSNHTNFEKRNIQPKILGPITGSLKARDFKNTLSFRARFLDIFNSKRNAQDSSFKSKLINSIYRIITSTSIYYLFREYRIYRRLINCQLISKTLIKKIRTEIVISISDRSNDYVEGSVLSAAKSLGIPVVLPYVAQFDINAALKYRKRSDGKTLPGLNCKDSLSLYKIYSRIRLKKQIYDDVFFQEPFILNAARRAGILSSYSWWIGNGLSDFVCVDSYRTKKKYYSNSVPKEKIIIIGQVQLDSVFLSSNKRIEIREMLNKKYSLNEKNDLLILSLPQYAEQGYMSSNEHWKKVNEIVKNITEVDKNLLLSIHPRCNINDYKYLENDFCCKIMSESLSDVIGASNLFLASNSSTLIWSTLCGIPSIGLYSPVPFLYNDISSIIQVDDNLMLSSAIYEALSRPQENFFEDWKNLSREEVFDGRFKQRFIKLLKSTIK